jgi:hypothetical protein
MSWPSGKYQPHHAASSSVVDESADSETWSDYVPVAVHSVPLESSGRAEQYSRSIGEVNEPHNDRDIENLAIEIAELQQMMDRVGSKVVASPRAHSAAPEIASGHTELREQAEMLHQYYVSTLGSSDSVSPILGDPVVSPARLLDPIISPRRAEGDEASLLRQQLVSAESAKTSLQKENAALAKLLAEHLPHLQDGQHHAPIEPTALDLPNSLKYTSAAVSKSSNSLPEPVSYVHFATEDLTVLRNFVEQLDVDSLPVDFARASVSDAVASLAAINMEQAKKLEQVGSVLANSEDSWKPAALAAQSKNLELQAVVADLNKRVLDLTQALDKHNFQAAQNSAQVCNYFQFRLHHFFCLITYVQCFYFGKSQQSNFHLNRRSATCCWFKTILLSRTPRRRPS